MENPRELIVGPTKQWPTRSEERVSLLKDASTFVHDNGNARVVETTLKWWKQRLSGGNNAQAVVSNLPKSGRFISRVLALYKPSFNPFRVGHLPYHSQSLKKDSMLESWVVRRLASFQVMCPALIIPIISIQF